MSEFVRLRSCPQCDGRGWHLINPFATGGSNGVGGIANMRQCETCARAEQHYKQAGELPADIVEAIKDRDDKLSEERRPQRIIEKLKKNIEELNKKVSELENELENAEEDASFYRGELHDWERRDVVEAGQLRKLLMRWYLTGGVSDETLREVAEAADIEIGVML